MFLLALPHARGAHAPRRFQPGCIPTLLGVCSALLSACAGYRATDTDQSLEREISENTRANVCAEVELETSATAPEIYLVVDVSLSMSGAQYEEVKTALTGDNGVITRLQDRAKFGLALFRGSREALVINDKLVNNDEGASLGQAIVIAGEQSFEDIATLVEGAKQRGGTPTGTALEVVFAQMLARRHDDTPQVVLLVTDGGPTDIKFDYNQTDEVASRRLVEQQIRTAFAAGIRTYSLSLALRDSDRDHIARIANLGVGKDPEDGDAVAYQPDSEAELTSTLSSLVRTHLSCTLDLQGEINDSETACAKGRVSLTSEDGVEALPCDQSDGWRVHSSTQIELVGSACERLQGTDGLRVAATFPCNAAVVVQ